MTRRKTCRTSHEPLAIGLFYRGEQKEKAIRNRKRERKKKKQERARERWNGTHAQQNGFCFDFGSRSSIISTIACLHQHLFNSCTHKNDAQQPPAPTACDRSATYLSIDGNRFCLYRLFTAMPVQKRFFFNYLLFFCIWTKDWINKRAHSIYLFQYLTWEFGCERVTSVFFM